MKRWQRVTLTVVVVLAVCAALVALIAPVVIKSQAEKKVEELTGRKLTIGRVFVNPLTWSAGADRVRLAEKNSTATFVSFSSARISLSPRSLFKGTPIVSEFHLVSPVVSIERSAASTYNFSDLLEKKEPEPKTGKKEETKFCINNISISRGTLFFNDGAVSPGRKHEVSNISLAIPFISTIDYLADKYITPQFSAVVNGSPFRLDAKLKKLPASAEVIVGLNVRDISLPWYMAYVPAKLPIAVEKGTLATTVDVTYRVAANKSPQFLLSGTATLVDFKLNERGGAPVAAMKNGSVTIKEADVFGRRYDISSISIEAVDLHLLRDKRGLNLAGLVPEQEKKKDEKEVSLHLGSAKLREGRVFFTDRQPQQEFSTVVSGLSLDLSDYYSTGNRQAPFDVSCATGRKEKLGAKGTISFAPLGANAFITATDISLAAYHPYLVEWLTAPVKGKLSLAGKLAYDKEAGLRIEKGRVGLDSLVASFGADEGVKIGRLAVDNVALNLAERRLAVERVTVRKSDVRVSRDKEGRFSALNLIKEKKITAGPSVPSKAPAEKPFAWSVASVAGDRMDFLFRDAMKEDLPEFSLRKASLSLRNLNSSGRDAIPFRVSSSFGKNGAVAASGEYVQKPGALRGTCDIKRIPLTDFEAYLPPDLNITLADGSLDASVRVNLAMKEGAWSGGFSGDAGVRSFYCLDAEGDDLLKWESLQLDGVSGTLGPFTLAVTDVALSRYLAKIVVLKDGTLNLQHLVEEEPEGVAPKVPASEKTQQTRSAGAGGQASPQKPAESPRNIKIGAVVMQAGVLNFTDQRLKPIYSTTFYNLGGRVSGLTSDANRFADVDLRGNLENQSPLQITGQINPLRDDLFVNLKMRFSDIELSPLSPYSSTYLGYLIDKGKLFLDLQYHIEQRKLESQNTLFLDQLTLGQKVESEKATSLPVRLAIALLKDRKGEIHLDLPVSGRTDDPKFSVWGVAMEMLKNLAVKAATAPFSLLQSLFGVKEDFSSVHFAAGSAALSDADREKLLKMASVLKARPAVKLEAAGYVDREHDPEGLRKELMEKKIRTEKFLELVKERKNQQGDSPETMKLTPEEYSKYLKVVYRKEKFPKPRTIIGTVKDLPDSEMKKLILTNTVVGTKDLQMLAADRTAAVRDFLVGKGQLDAARIFQKSPDILKEPAKKGESASRVEFGIAVD